MLGCISPLCSFTYFFDDQDKKKCILTGKQILGPSPKESIKTSVPILWKIFSAKVPVFKVKPPPSDHSFTLKQVFENVGGKINGHWKTAFRFQSSFYCYSEAVYCLNYLILSCYGFSNNLTVEIGIQSRTLFYRGFLVPTQIRLCNDASLRFIPYLVSLKQTFQNSN